MENSHLNDIELFEYATGELPEGDRARAEHHIASCDECRSMLALAQAGEHALRSSPQLELRPEALERALGSLGSQEAPTDARQPRFSLQRWLTILAPAAAIAGVVVIVVFAARGGSDGDTSAEPALPAAAESVPAEAAEAPADRSVQVAPPEEESFDAAAPSADSAGDVGALAENAAPAQPAEPEAALEPEPELPAEAASEPAAEEPAEESVRNGADSATTVGRTAEEIVTLLADAEIDATIAEDGAVEVAEADYDATLEVLSGLPEGDQVVRVATP